MQIQDQLTNIKNNTERVNFEKAANKANDELDQDAFLQLMMVQMQHQDPTNPMDTSQMLTQQSQFTMVSELQKLNATNYLLQASSLIGKEVELTDPDKAYDPENPDANKMSGIVKEAQVTSKGVMINLEGDDRAFNSKEILKVKKETVS